MTVLTDPAECGPGDVWRSARMCRREAYDYPESFFDERVWSPRRPRPDRDELAAAVAGACKRRKEAAGDRRWRRHLFRRLRKELAEFVEAAGIPVCETQGGKSSLPDSHPLNMAAVGVTGTFCRKPAGARGRRDH